MKKIIILLVIVLVGAGATAGALTSASLGWTLKSVDEKIIDFGNISVELPKPVKGDICLSVDVGLYPVGANVTITLENMGNKTAYFYGAPYHWIIDKYTDGTWEKIYPNGIELMGFFVTQIDPGEKEVDVWDQKIFDDALSGKVQVDPGDYRVVVNYCMGEEKYEFAERVYFSISNYAGTIGGDPAENITLEPPDYPVIWKGQESILIPFLPMQTLPLDEILPPKIPVPKIPLGQILQYH